MKLLLLTEPSLQFADGVHVDIRAGIGSFGALDRGAPGIPVPIRVGVVGTAETVDPLCEWVTQCAAGIESEEARLTDLRPSFPGVSETTFGTRLEFAAAITRSISTRDVNRAGNAHDAIGATADLFLDHARDLASRGDVNVLLVAPPVSVFRLGEEPHKPSESSDELDEGSDEDPDLYRRCFHDAYKARSLELLVPSQVIRPDTYNAGSTRKGRKGAAPLQEEATRAWNLCTALYYKAGAVPWRLVRDPSSLSTCFVGISFFRTVDQERVLASVAQVFDERGEGVIVQGGSARIDKFDRSPHLTADDAGRLVARALEAYRREHRTAPARLVVHKTSYFDPHERRGMRDAAEEQNVDTLELINVRRGGARLYRDGTYPVLRGTAHLFDDTSGAVYLRGSVPQFRTYPGMYVPASLEFERAHGEMSSREIARELLELSKLNFNNTQFDGAEPITVRAARRVGDILKHVSPERMVDSRFRFFT